MNRRSLIKYLVALPVCKIVKTFAASRPTKEILKRNPDYVPWKSSQGRYNPDGSWSGVGYYKIRTDTNPDGSLSKSYRCVMDCGHEDWIQSPGITDPEGRIADTTRMNIYDSLPRWAGKCQDCIRAGWPTVKPKRFQSGK